MHFVAEWGKKKFIVVVAWDHSTFQHCFVNEVAEVHIEVCRKVEKKDVGGECLSLKYDMSKCNEAALEEEAWHCAEEEVSGRKL